MYLGSYTATSGGHGTGITVLERASVAEAWRAVQVVPADDPSFLALSEGALHAASETTEGRVLSYTVSAGELVAASLAASGGTAPCHALVAGTPGSLIVTNYTAGTVGVLSTDALDPGRVTRVVALPSGSGPVADRQASPHAHSSTSTPWGTVLVSDLGTDRVYEIAVDPVTQEPSFVAAHAMPQGSGPRHFAWFGERLLVVGELDGHVHMLTHAENGFTLDQSIPAFDVAHPGDAALLSHIEVAGSLVYVAVRGRDTITVLSLDGATGLLGFVAEVPCGGRWPRHFAVTPSALYVANQFSDAVAVLPLDPATGVPGAAVVQIETGSPACVVFA